ncbi:MAG: sigma factor-like helix-turn-helix DNA-binding protein [Saccharofermentanales bacterium]
MPGVENRKYNLIRAPPTGFFPIGNRRKNHGGNNMEFNHGRERSKFTARWEKLAKQYEAIGMKDSDIQEIYDFDVKTFRRDRNYLSHLHGEISDDFLATEDPDHIDGLNESTELSSDPAEFIGTGRFDWVDDIGTPGLSELLKNLSDSDLDLLTLYVFEGYSQQEIAQKTGRTQSAISRRFNKLFKIMKNI